MLLTVKQLAHRYQVTEQTIRSWAKRRNMPVIRVGPTLRFNNLDLDQWEKTQTDITVKRDNLG